MKGSITLTRAAFERWCDSILSPNALNGFRETMKQSWHSLIEESQKPERIEAWAVRYPDCAVGVYYQKPVAEDLAKRFQGSQLIKLVEEVGV